MWIPEHKSGSLLGKDPTARHRTHSVMGLNCNAIRIAVQFKANVPQTIVDLRHDRNLAPILVQTTLQLHHIPIYLHFFRWCRRT